jgi:hypothetical protein
MDEFFNLDTRNRSRQAQPHAHSNRDYYDVMQCAGLGPTFASVPARILPFSAEFPAQREIVLFLCLHIFVYKGKKIWVAVVPEADLVPRVSSLMRLQCPAVDFPEGVLDIAMCDLAINTLDPCTSHVRGTRCYVRGWILQSCEGVGPAAACRICSVAKRYGGSEEDARD